jgi:ubiquinone/menaquinone biosynthesis C-methylase UbiE
MDHESWDNLAADYDVSVEDNPSPLIVDYIDQEIQILNVLCEKHARAKSNFSIIDMGAGTGRVVFALEKKLRNDSIEFFGVENSDSMLNFANHKNNNHDGVSKISFLKHDLTDSNLSEYFDSKDANIVMCSYNTLGVVPSDKRQRFIDNMKIIAGKNGLVVLTMFNGDDFGFVAPKLYRSMITMIKQIDDDSFDEDNRVFHNSLGFRSQWFTKNEIKHMLNTSIDPNPIDVVVDDKRFTFGNVFVDRDV